MHYRVILVLFLTLSIPIILSSLSYGSIARYNWVELVNPDWLKEVETYTGFLYPRIGLPAFIAPYTSFNIVLYNPQVGGEVDRIYIYRGGLEVELEILDTIASGDKLIVTVGLGEAYGGLYDLYVEANGRVLTENNSIYVRDSLDYPLRIFRLSDTHYDARVSGIQQRENFLEIIWRANFLNPDLVLVTGDVLNSATHENYKKFVRDLSLYLKVPLVFIPGNHDHHYREDLITYYVAPSNISINIGPLHLIIIDTGPNSLNGWIRNSQVEWLIEDLERYRDMPVKIAASHHPFSLLLDDETSNRTWLEEVLAGSDIDLILHGHMHYFMPELELYPPRITDPNAYEGGDPYTGFRIITIRGPGDIEWMYGESIEPYPLFDLRVYEYQYDDGSNMGYYLLVENDMDVPVEGVVHAYLGFDEPAVAEGIDLSKAEIVRYPGFTEVIYPVIVDPGGSLEVKIYGLRDDEPPIMMDITLEEVGRTTTGLTISIYDRVSGVADLKVRYTIDNETWTMVDVYRLTPTEFFTLVRHEEDNGFMIIIEAIDPEGNRFESGILNYSLVLKPKEVGVEAEPIQLDQALIIGVLVIAIFTAILLLRYKKIR